VLAHACHVFTKKPGNFGARQVVNYYIQGIIAGFDLTLRTIMVREAFGEQRKTVSIGGICERQHWR
jgi:hypothetical protein